MLRVLLDTNVLVAAARFRGSAPSRVVQGAADGMFEVIITDLLLREVERAFRAQFGRALAKDGYRLLAQMPEKHVVWPFEWSHLEADVQTLVSDRGDVPHICAFMAGGGDLFVTLDTKLVRMPVRAHVRFAQPEEALRVIGIPNGGARGKGR